MKWTTGLIRRHIMLLGEGKAFSTRDCLSYGKRAAVDQALNRMVKNEEIIRLARGVFCKWSIKKIPSMIEIVETKAKAFGRQIFTHGARAAYELGLIKKKQAFPHFATLAQTSSFQCGTRRILLKRISLRDALLGDSIPGLALRAIRWLKRTRRIRPILQKLKRRLKRPDLQILRESTSLMPAWFSDFLFIKKVPTHLTTVRCFDD
jgi:hypothetical protein